MNALHNLINNPSKIKPVNSRTWFAQGFAEFVARCGGGPVLATARWGLNTSALDRIVAGWRRECPNTELDPSWHHARDFRVWRAEWLRRYRRYRGVIVVTADVGPFNRYSIALDAWEQAKPKAPRGSPEHREWRRRESQPPPRALAGDDHYVGLATMVELLSIGVHRLSAPMLWCAIEPPMSVTLVDAFAIIPRDPPSYTAFADIVPWPHASQFEPLTGDFEFQYFTEYTPESFLREVGISAAYLLNNTAVSGAVNTQDNPIPDAMRPRLAVVGA